MIEAGLIRQRTGEGMAIPRARGKLRGKPPKLSPAQTREAHRIHASGDYAIAQIAQLFSVSRPTIYRALQRTTGGADLPLTPAHAPTWRNAIRCCPRAGQAEVSPGRE
jgi:DNA invertase Pin-like site-specific DNA recombinase